MTNPLARLESLKRPRLLINAARIGAPEYRREIHLARHMGDETLPESADALTRLIELEAEIDIARRARIADYSVARHVDVLIAIMGEARILRASASFQVVPGCPADRVPEYAG